MRLYIFISYTIHTFRYCCLGNVRERVQRVRVRGREGGEKKGVGRKGGERKRGVREGYGVEVRREGRGKGRSGKKWRGKGGEREGKGGGRGGSERECGGVEQYSPSTSSKGISRLSLHRPERVRGQGSNTAAMYWYGWVCSAHNCVHPTAGWAHSKLPAPEPTDSRSLSLHSLARF